MKTLDALINDGRLGCFQQPCDWAYFGTHRDLYAKRPIERWTARWSGFSGGPRWFASLSKALLVSVVVFLVRVYVTLPSTSLQAVLCGSFLKAERRMSYWRVLSEHLVILLLQCRRMEEVKRRRPASDVEIIVRPLHICSGATSKWCWYHWCAVARMQWSDEGQQTMLLLLCRRIEEATRLIPAVQSLRSSWETMGYRVMMLSHWRGWATNAIMWFWRLDLRVASLPVFSISCRFEYLIAGIKLGVDAQWLHSGASADKMPYDATFFRASDCVVRDSFSSHRVCIMKSLSRVRIAKVFSAFSVCCQTIIIIIIITIITIIIITWQ